MGCFAGSGGHNKIVPGANSQYGIEHVEDRRFLDAVASYVQAAGWKYVNCSDEVGTTKTAVWSNAADNHLRVKDSDVDCQFHLNASPGGTGCEVWLHPSYGNRELAAKISKVMADAFGLRDRGIKFSTELGWINKTKTGLLPEICFIDNETDMQKYRANFDKAAKAVAEVIVGRSIQSSGTSQSIAPSKQNVIQTGAFSPYETPDVMGALNSLKMTADFKLQSNGLTYFVTEPTSDAQLNGMKGWLDKKGWWYEVK
ncbi:N-acetylmuramoyl-L-alanine amidase [Bacillus sp. CH126_4D]|uniref:N-acetylmuramoyl-L-alanine amidase C-terminal domain-containing protein n=1 Tax=unclassified Bacillus (in: firmicutes) TaxID=185979 RepID=UPI00124BE32A|nr:MULTISPECIES: N-acetylmuramoyl-L-alanine amidase C-terminal domain-containing protein [unclassified Bacillus (in: firmicutes)]KAB2460797.1 N-acetylmuramoyl-L-alanine amidase [Bacillus sp. CH140a_4T]KAB2476441.1 N-acetylmuramoyl-L-alanine amidase [Bacillus sp. CH126_4D]